MAQCKTRGVPEQEWKKRPKDWYSIYNWGPAKSQSYTEQIAEWICEDFDKIKLKSEGLRKKDFRKKNRVGRAETKLRGGDLKGSERLLCRAMYNQDSVKGLGRALDYEIPLKNKQDARHGKIDLVFRRANEVLVEVLVIEAKRPKSNESMLKGLLESYVYARLVCNLRKQFSEEYQLEEEIVIRPLFLTFRDAKSGMQLECIRDDSNALPNLRGLLRRLNEELEKKSINPIELRLADDIKSELDVSKDGKVVFSDGFRLGTSLVEIRD